MQNMGQVTQGDTTRAPSLQVPTHPPKMIPRTYVASTQSRNQTDRAPGHTHAREPRSNRFISNPIKVTQTGGTPRLQVWPQQTDPCLKVPADRVEEVAKGKALLNTVRQTSGHPRDPVRHFICGYTHMACYPHEFDHPSLIPQTRQNVSNLELEVVSFRYSQAIAETRKLPPRVLQSQDPAHARTSRVLGSLKNGKELR